MADESLFNIDHYVGSHWAPSKQPILTTSRYTYQPRVVVCSVISALRGKVYSHYGIRSFSAQDMIDLLRQLRAACGPDARLCLFWDNCRIHQATIVREAAASDEINIQLVWNCAYRPDLAAIELFWAEVKRRYRRELDRFKAHNL